MVAYCHTRDGLVRQIRFSLLKAKTSLVTVKGLEVCFLLPEVNVDMLTLDVCFRTFAERCTAQLTTQQRQRTPHVYD